MKIEKLAPPQEKFDTASLVFQPPNSSDLQVLRNSPKLCTFRIKFSKAYYIVCPVLAVGITGSFTLQLIHYYLKITDY